MNVCVSERLCALPVDLENGYRDECEPAYEYGVTCSYKCDPGYHQQPLPVIHTIKCIAEIVAGSVLTQMMWDNDPTPCNSNWFTFILLPTLRWHKPIVVSITVDVSTCSKNIISLVHWLMKCYEINVISAKS